MKYFITASSVRYEEDQSVILLKDFPQINDFNPTIEDGMLSVELTTLEEFNEFCTKINNEIIISHYNLTNNYFVLEIYDTWRE